MTDGVAATGRLHSQPESADLDELFVDAAQLRLERTGLARYRLQLEAADGVVSEIDFWTSRKGSLQVSVDADEQVGGVLGLVLWQVDGAVERLETAACRCHVERLSRGLCWLGLSAGDLPAVHVNLASRGYVKARLRRSSRARP
ncbi:hypothetical protein [Tahibacter caeni]|uniref:hypothetical protein n=1 Tax=Tahibacter caeni TaxID=1453545 RepID=UPI00214872F1|nr:hypothetical protein [Tahibacter caeni]